MSRMEELFPEFYVEQLDFADFKLENKNLVVLDTNILSDILGLPTDLAEKYLDTIDMIKDHSFIPSIVGFEYHFNKQSIKVSTEIQKKSYANSITKAMQDTIENFKDKHGNDLLGFLRNKDQKKEVRDSVLEIVRVAEIEREINKIFDRKYTKDVNELQNRLRLIINDSVAEKLTQEWINAVQKKGEERYKLQIPPGVDDSKKDNDRNPNRIYAGLTYERKYGDYILWEELLHKISRDGASLGKKVIFVTNDGVSDKKVDLLYKQSGRTIGPRIELMTELWNLKYGYNILEESKSSNQIVCKELYIINSEKFIQLVNRLSDEEAQQYRMQELPFDNKDIKQYNLFIFDRFYQNEKNQKKLKDIDDELEKVGLEFAEVDRILTFEDYYSKEERDHLEYKKDYLEKKISFLKDQRGLLELELKKSRFNPNEFDVFDDDFPF